MKILLTGAAGFIGFHLARPLVERGDEVVGLDNINGYYDRGLKYARLKELGISREAAESGKLTRSSVWPGFRFIKADLQDWEALEGLFAAEGFAGVCHLAAQAGVRYSIENPAAYVESNIAGFLTVLEGCRRHQVGHLVYASSSSVYGLNEAMPFSTAHNVDHPVSLYAASKKSNELMAHTYSHLFGVPTTGLRFFTVYGPWGRPDMAYFLFTRAILEGRPIDVFNHGDMKRDFTYIDDIVEGVVRVLDAPAAGNGAWSGAAPDPASSRAPYRVYNIGRGAPVALMDFIGNLESSLGKTAQKRFLPLQPGDVAATWADTGDLERDFGYKPSTSVSQGVGEFVRWYLAREEKK